MKRLKTFWLLSLFQIFILLLYLGLQSVFFQQSFKVFYYKEKEKNLLAEANIIKHQITTLLKDSNHLQKMVTNLGEIGDSRITVVLPSGRVIADSIMPLEKLDNHKNRPEVKLAFGGNSASNIRFSDSLNQETLYIAIPLYEDGLITGVLRLSKTIESMKSSFSSIFNRFFGGSLIITLFLILIISFYTKNLNLSLEKMSFITEKFLKGDYFEKIKISPWDSVEISSLGKSLNKMGGQIEDQINKIIKQRKELEAVFSSMTEGVLTLTPVKKIYHINTSAKKIFNLDLEKSYKGIPLEEAIRVKKIEEFFDEVYEKKILLNAELELKDNKYFQVNGSILTGETGGTYGALLVFNNISEIRKLEKHRKEFVANVSHELKTPLTAINGYLENLVDGSVDSPEDRLKFLKVIQKQSIRLQKIIEDLLVLSQIESEGNFSGEIMEIGPFLSSAKSLFKENIKLDCGKNLKAYINSHLLEIAISNLLQNAIRYGKKDAPILLTGKESNGMIEISVSDQGVGIAPEHHSRLFERFYSVDKSRSREFGGSGLGLSIVKHIALAHKGYVGVESSIGKGSKFTIYLPKA